MDLSGRGLAVLDDDLAHLRAEGIAAQAATLPPEQREIYVGTQVSILKDIQREIDDGERSEDYARGLSDAAREAMAGRAA